MADTRCADPDLQLDVDIMILEYTLYKAVQAQFDLASSGHQDEAKAVESTRILSIFDSFIQIFNQMHPSHVKSPDFYTNLDILEFLVLLSSRSAKTTPFSADTPKKLHDQTMRNLDSRRQWLVAREHYVQRNFETRMQQDFEDQIYHAWTSRPIFTQTASQCNDQPSLFDLLTRFVSISADFSALTGQHPNDKWMEIACEFILQASMEALQSRLGAGIYEKTQPGLDDCFAWGYISDDLLYADDEQTELLNDLFRNPETGTTEGPRWTNLRAQYLSELSIAFDVSAQSQACRLDRLANKYPLASYQEGLVSFMASLWNIYCEQLGGKPVLLQIEEGHLKTLGLEGREFDEFMVRVGLKDGEGGILNLHLGMDLDCVQRGPRGAATR
ncbi:hypothetical protein EDD37DRAFT_307362 [Exophiala viscosa]|uniref:uncharacterized protein n=1 Tax=Exophiala viscosa TaxID=2486360 RepID=UPI0021931F83|nr:hypothetical protein EDD37DRAFT_307362 [Exophiala viscosa]